MNEVIVLLNDVREGMRRVHVMSDAPIREEWMAQVPEGAAVKEYKDEIRLYHLEAEWKARGDLMMFEMRFPCGTECAVCNGSGCAWRRMVALWCLTQGERISQAIGEAAEAYAFATGQDPMYAWVRDMPKGVEYGTPIPVPSPISGTEIGEGGIEILLFSADWMPERAVAVGRGNS